MLDHLARLKGLANAGERKDVVATLLKQVNLFDVRKKALGGFSGGMYALADYIGEDNLNRAIRAFRDETAFKGPPYPNATQFLTHVRAVTPPQYQYVIDDWFETITLYDNRAQSAAARSLPDGRYEVTLTVVARKRKADDLGHEDEAPLHDLIDIGVLGAEGEPLFLEKRRIDREQTSFTVVVGKRPARAGIDPYNKLIDRSPKDNTVAVTIE